MAANGDRAAGDEDSWKGHLADAATGKSVLLVVRRGTLRIFAGSAPRERHVGLPDETLPLVHRSEVRLEPGCVVRIQTQLPYEAEHVFRARTQEEAKQCCQAIQRSVAATAERLRAHLHLLAQGSTAYKYNYSNSKRMRRHFWVDEAKVELCWGKSRGDEAPQNMDLKDCVGIIYGPMTSTFQRCSALEDPPYCCFSLLFADRTLDLAVAGEMVQQWFLGLQHLLLRRSPGCVTEMSEAQFAFRKVQHKFRGMAHQQGLTTRTLLVRQLRLLAQDPTGAATASSSSAPARARAGTGADGEADSAPGGAGKVPRPKRKQTATNGAEVNGAAASSSSSAPINGTAAAAVGGAKRRPSGGDAPRPFAPPAREGGGAAGGGEEDGEDGDGAEEADRALRASNGTTQRQLQAERQLKRLAKQFRDSEAQVQALEQELRAVEAGAGSADRAAQPASAVAGAAPGAAQARTAELQRRVQELEQQLAKADDGGAELALLQEQNRKQAERLEALRQENGELSQRLAALTQDVEAAQARRRENERRIEACQGLSRNLVELLRRLLGVVAGLRAEHREVKARCADELRSIADDFQPLAKSVHAVGAARQGMEQRYAELSQEREKLHKLVLELKAKTGS